MPNWCQNEVDITGDEATIKKIADIIEARGQFLMNDFVPMPQHLEGTTSPDGSDNFQEALNSNREISYTNWYDWRLAHWGTKWDLDENTQHNISETEIGLGFDTAWSPNCDFWELFTEKYPTLTVEHKYLEDGMEFIGEATYKQGQMDGFHTNITDDMYVKVGVILDDEGNFDWNADQDYNLWDLFPLRKEQELV